MLTFSYQELELLQRGNTEAQQKATNIDCCRLNLGVYTTIDQTCGECIPTMNSYKETYARRLNDIRQRRN
jgi:hypothetical protein